MAAGYLAGRSAREHLAVRCAVHRARCHAGARGTVLDGPRFVGVRALRPWLVPLIVGVVICLAALVLIFLLVR